MYLSGQISQIDGFANIVAAKQLQAANERDKLKAKVTFQTVHEIMNSGKLPKVLPPMESEHSSFSVCTKLAEMAILYSKDLTTAKKVTSSGARPDATDYYWFRSPMPNQMS